jgi:hypothetical protein
LSMRTRTGMEGLTSVSLWRWWPRSTRQFDISCCIL